MGPTNVANSRIMFLTAWLVGSSLVIQQEQLKHQHTNWGHHTKKETARIIKTKTIV